MNEIQHLVINLSGCSQLTDISAIGHSLKEMKKIHHLDMYFSGCELTDISAIGHGPKEIV